jgi:hypothetical protein
MSAGLSCRLSNQQQILLDREISKDVFALRDVHQAGSRPLMRCEVTNGLAVQEHLPVDSRIAPRPACASIDQGALACPVGSCHTDHPAGRHHQASILQGYAAGIPYRQIASV